MNSKLPIISFDIDYTLFDTDKFRMYVPSDLTMWDIQQLPFDICVYPEVLSVLPTLQRAFRFGICSISEIDEYQWAKLTRTGLARFFDPDLVFIGNDIDALLKEMRQTVPMLHYAVDDLPTKLERIKVVYPEVVTVRVKKGKHAVKTFPFQSDYEIDDLHGLSRIVFRN